MNRPDTSPTLYTMAPGVPFLRALAHGLYERFHTDDPLDFARVTVFLPTRRSVRVLRNELQHTAADRGYDALLMPEVCALGDVDEDELVVSLPRDADAGDSLDLPPAIGEMRRRILLAQLIERWSEKRHRAEQTFAPMGTAQAIMMATSLAHLVDHLHTEGASLEKLSDLVPAQYAGHWQTTVEFLSILSHHWPEILQSEGAIDPGERRSRLLRALACQWTRRPPAHPVIAAGSTGSIPATSDLLAVIARLPKGAVLLPGLDIDTDEDCWSGLDAPHPQYGLKNLLEHLGARRQDVALWEDHNYAASSSPARARLWSAVFRPAAATDRWPELARQAATPEALSGLYRINADDPAQEAGIIACILRQTLETPGRTGALVTPDRDLARRVAGEMRRWQIDIDDSAGQPLAGTRTGIFLRCILDALESHFAPVTLLGLLKNDLCRLGMTAEVRHDAVSILERTELRGPKPPPGLAALQRRIEGDRHKDRNDVLTLLKQLDRATVRLRRLSKGGKAPLHEFARAHVAAAEALAASKDGASLWQSDDGRIALALFEDLMAPIDGPNWTLSEYAISLTQWLRDRPMHERRDGQPRLSILGPLEARLQHADVMILGGLNEGTWPSAPKPDPWLNRPMQSRLGLPDPDRRIGQAAHDFTQLACAEKVYLTRAAKVEGSPQLPSRWLLRLDTVLNAAGLDHKVAAAPNPLPEIFHRLDRRMNRRRISDPRPSPPAEARPVQMPVTAVETLIRDPYAAYACHVLGLYALEPLEAEPGPGEHGSFVHDALYGFTERFADNLPGGKSEAVEALFEEGTRALKQALGPDWVHPAAHIFWRARFEAAAQWFVDWEYARRAAGTSPLLWEARGKLVVDAARPFTLTARADRIDLLPDGTHAIVDYKTGRAPSDREVGAGFAPQLPLEGAILEAGGFEGTKAGRAGALLYVMLGGGRNPGEERTITGGAGSADGCISHALAGLQALITQYQNESTPFLSRPHVRFITQRSDYDHLARVKEWSAGGEEGGE